MEGIHFGTDGWRGVIAENFTFQNVRRVGRALVLLMKEKMITDKPAIIAYDFRFLSEFFARTIHDELIAGGMKSILSDRAIPTPALSLAVKKRRGAFGVMITASHNPHFYNGIKFKASYGGPVMPDFTSDVT
ncbi:MAG TPA: phosphoglucomutase/phosphomannomutase family protein, partial [Candidatus Sumerlaeota bacterium]|nr:phosphoglucomutase/phosphomannomutase family protein [Candidatus Sumerlaeota bacterium]